jgi:hypothetical protein
MDFGYLIRVRQIAALLDRCSAAGNRYGSGEGGNG